MLHWGASNFTASSHWFWNKWTLLFYCSICDKYTTLKLPKSSKAIANIVFSFFLLQWNIYFNIYFDCRVKTISECNPGLLSFQHPLFSCLGIWLHLEFILEKLLWCGIRKQVDHWVDHRLPAPATFPSLDGEEKGKLWPFPHVPVTPAPRVTQPGAPRLSGYSQLGCWSPSRLISNRLPPPGSAGDTSSPRALQSASSYRHGWMDGRMDGRVAHISANGTCSLFSEQFEDIIKQVPRSALLCVVTAGATGGLLTALLFKHVNTWAKAPGTMCL